jgi:hypothetical protein
MGTIFLDDIVTDPDLAESYTVERSVGGMFVAGGYQDSKTTLAMYGVVSRDVSNELDMVPEGDRVKELRAFWSAKPIYRTNENGVSDILIWNNEKYRVLFVANYMNRKYWKAIAARMKGD